MIILETENNKFRVITQLFKTGWLPNTPANRKVVVIMLRNLEDENGNPLFIHRELATILGSKVPSAASDHVEKFRACGEEFDKALRYRYKVNEEIIQVVIEVLSEYDPMLSQRKIAILVREKLGRNDIGRDTIISALEQISANEIRKILKKQLAKGHVDYKKQYVFQRLFKLATEKIEESGIVTIPDKLQLELSKATEPIGCMSVEKIKSKQVDEDAKHLFEGDVNLEKLAFIWNGPLGWKLWAFILYLQGISQSVIGSWIGVNKSTICRWLKDVFELGNIWLRTQKVASSAKMAIDEKWIKIAGKFWFLFAAVDCVTGYPLHTAIYPSNDGDYCKLFLLELKKLGYRPKIIITDGWNSYIESIPAVFPQAQHLLCRFHVLRSVFVRLKKARIFDVCIFEAVGNLFKTHYKRTVTRRVERLKKLLQPLGATKSVLSGLQAKWPQVIKAVGSTWRPSTSNAVEGFFCKFEKFYKLKGPFVDEKSAHKHLKLFLLQHLLTIGAKGQPCPLEKAGGNVVQLPLYHLINRPNILVLKDKMAE